MSSNLLHGFAPVWDWMGVNRKALDELEISLQRRIYEYNDSEARTELEQIGHCREELENFAMLSLWAVFEETLNTWLAQRTYWAGVSPEDDKDVRKGLLRRIQYWTVAEKIDALKPLFGKELAQNLHTLRCWRDWVAHRKAGPRPSVSDIEMAQSLFEQALGRLDGAPEGATEPLV